VSDWINGWNETSAMKFCEDAFTFDPAVETCNEHLNISAEPYIDSCIEDIKAIFFLSVLLYFVQIK
jgi:hypothetical protein